LLLEPPENTRPPGELQRALQVDISETVAGALQKAEEEVRAGRRQLSLVLGIALPRSPRCDECGVMLGATPQYMGVHGDASRDLSLAPLRLPAILERHEVDTQDSEPQARARG
jgi:hypothetical protein